MANVPQGNRQAYGALQETIIHGEKGEILRLPGSHRCLALKQQHLLAEMYDIHTYVRYMVYRSGYIASEKLIARQANLCCMAVTHGRGSKCRSAFCGKYNDRMLCNSSY